MDSAPPSIKQEGRRGAPWRKAAGWFGLAVVCALVIGWYRWIARPAISQLHGATASQVYYNLLVDGLRSGKLSLKQDPAAELVRLADPYDPAQNAAYRLHDVSYFQGRYYLYFGITPALVLFWPYVAVTGHYLWHKEAVMIFCAGGFLFSVGIMLALRRRYFPRIGAVVLAAGALALGGATFAPILLRRPDVWEVPISCAYLLLMAALAAVDRALHDERRPALWLALASLAFGAAVGARPAVLFCGVMLLVPLAERIARDGTQAWRLPTWRRLATAATGPMAGVGAILLLYNYQRFGSPWEFGQNYQLAQDNQHSVQHFSWRFLWFNFRVYFLAPARLGSYFPFVRGIDLPSAPSGQFGVENPFGVLLNTPVTWLALAAPLAWQNRLAAERRKLRALIGAIALVFGLNALTICLFGGACVRYEVDFTPALVLLAVIGILGLERALSARTGWRWFARVGWTTLLLWSVGFNFFASCEHWDLLHTQNPRDYRWLARVFDHPAYWSERRRGEQPGALELRLKLPPFTSPRIEPLVVTGEDQHADFLFINYLNPRQVMIGFEHAGYADSHTPAIPWDYSQEHTLVVEMGSLYPPAEHPYFENPDVFETTAHTEQLRVRLDGAVVLENRQVFYFATPQTRFIGVNPYAQQFGRVFTGSIMAQDIRPAAPALARGAIKFRQVLFPAGPIPRNEPLVAVGAAGQSDLLYVRTERAGILRFGYVHAGEAPHESGEVAFAPDSRHDLEIRFGSLLPAAKNAAQAAAQRSLVVQLDGAVAWSRPVAYVENPAPGAVVARNAIGSAFCDQAFTGSIVNVQRVNPVESGEVGANLPWRIDLMLPIDRIGRSEPLVVTGRPGKGDLFYITYLDVGHVRFGFDHWGVRSYQSDPVAVDYGQLQALEFRFEAIRAPHPDGRYPGKLELSVNGVQVWNAPVEYYDSPSATLKIGENLIGGSTCDPAFTGGFVRIEQPNIPEVTNGVAGQPNP